MGLAIRPAAWGPVDPIGRHRDVDCCGPGLAHTSRVVCLVSCITRLTQVNCDCEVLQQHIR